MPPRRNAHNSHSIQEFLNGTKRQRKEVKEQTKQFIKCPQLGQVGGQLKRVLQQYRNEIMQEFNYGELAKQVSTTDQGLLGSILYMNITRISNLWSEIYTPDNVQDVIIPLTQLLSQQNTEVLKYWLKNAFSILRQDQFSESESWDAQSNQINNQEWNYQMLNLYGSSGKLSTILAIARTYNIEVLYTDDCTAKLVFEEMFASEHIQFKEQQSNEFGNKKKIIIHRGMLPKFINQKMLQIQRVPLIWITDIKQNHELFDYYELIQYSYITIVNYIFTIMLIEYNYHNQLDLINQQFRQQVIYENIKNKGGFYINFKLTKPTIYIQDLQINYTLKDIQIIVLMLKGNMRHVFNWLQFNQDQKQQIQEMQLTEIQLQYMLKNKLPIFENWQNWYYERRFELIDPIIKERTKILIPNYRKTAYNSKMDTYLLNHVLKTLALHQPNTRQRRLKKEPVDAYKPLQQFFNDDEQYEKFKQFDRATDFS